MPLTRKQGWEIALAMPGVEERPYFNMPAAFVHDRFLTKVHHQEDAMLMQVGSMEMREMMLEAEPKLFYITPHFHKFPFVLMRLSALSAKTLKEILAGRSAQLAQMKPIKRAPKPPGKKPRNVKMKPVD